MFTDILILIAGFAMLIKGADFLVNGSSKLAAKLGVSPLIVGLTIVAFGTSAPELIVNIFASIQGSSSIAVGNIIGSNTVNIGLILGISALIIPLRISQQIITREIPLMLLSALVFFALVADNVFDHNQFGILSRNDGIVMLLVFSIFIYYLAIQILKQNHEHKTKSKESKNVTEKPKDSFFKLSLLILAGLLGVILGGKLVVDSAVVIAIDLGVSEALVGLTIVSVGTSLPELFTSVIAATKKQFDIAVGNIVGSNIFNTLFILGISGIINPIGFDTAWFGDLTIMIVFSLALLLFAVTYKKIIRRWEGGMLLIGYIVYITFTIIRG